MPVSLQVRGAEQYAALARKYKAAGQKIPKEAHKAFGRAVKPLKAEVQKRTGDFVPSGYAPVLSRSLSFRLRKRGGRDPGAQIITRGKGKTGTTRRVQVINAGTLQHPTYGNRDAWHAQRVKPGFVDVPMKEGADHVRRELIEAMETIAREF